MTKLLIVILSRYLAFSIYLYSIHVIFFSCNLVETVKAIEGSLGCNTRTPKTVMSKEAEYVYEKHMINAAKQQSLQEMVGITIIISV